MRALNFLPVFKQPQVPPFKILLTTTVCIFIVLSLFSLGQFLDGLSQTKVAGDGAVPAADVRPNNVRTGFTTNGHVTVLK